MSPPCASLAAPRHTSELSSIAQFFIESVPLLKPCHPAKLFPSKRDTHSLLLAVVSADAIVVVSPLVEFCGLVSPQEAKLIIVAAIAGKLNVLMFILVFYFLINCIFSGFHSIAASLA